MAANNSYEKSVALIAAANRVVQDPNSVGAALRTISLRLRGTSVKELEESGEDTTGAVESTSKLRSKIKSLSGVDILTDTGAYKDTYTILLEISKVWKDMSDIDQAALLEIIAGKTRSNTAAAILSNTKDLEEAYASAMEAEGSAFAENEKYLDSIQGKIDQFNNAMQTMWNNTLDDEVIKGFVELGTELIKIVDSLGLIKTLIIAIGAYSIEKHFNGNLIAGLFGDGKGDTQASYQYLKNRYDAAKAYADKHSKSKLAKKKLEKAQSEFKPLEERGKKSKKLKELKNQRKKIRQQMSTEQDPTKSKELNRKLNENKKAINDVKKSLGEIAPAAKKAENAGLSFTQKFNIGLKGLKSNLKKFGKQLRGIMSSMLTMYAITTVFELIGKGFDKLNERGKGLRESPEEAMEKFEQLNGKLSSTESELRSLESELDTTNDRIEELMDQGTLSFVEQEELDMLQERSSELERQIKLQESLADAIQKSVNAQAVQAGSAFLNNTSFYSEETKEEREAKAKEEGSTIGQVAGGALAAIVYAALVAGGVVTGGATTALAVAGGGMMAGGAIGGFIGSANEGENYDSEQTVLEAISTMSYDYSQLKSEQDKLFEAYTKIMNDEKASDSEREVAETNYINAVNSASQWQANMGQAMQQIQALYNSIDWETASDQQKAQKIEWGKMLANYTVTTGGKGAKSAAIDFLLSEEVNGDLEEQIKRAIENASKNGTDFDIYELFGDDAAVKKLDEDLREMGLTLVDVKYKYLDAAEAEGEFADFQLENSIDQIEKVVEALQQLKDAFAEWSEKGFVSSKTLQEMDQKFGDKDEIRDEYYEYLKVITDPNATTDQVAAATNALAEADVVSRIKEGLDDPSVYAQLVSELDAIGVEDAKALIEALSKKHLAEQISSKDLYYDGDQLMQKQYGEDGKEIAPRKANLNEFLGPYATEEDKEIVKQTILSQVMEAEIAELERLTTEYNDAVKDAEGARAQFNDSQLSQLDSEITDLKARKKELEKFSIAPAATETKLAEFGIKKTNEQEWYGPLEQKDVFTYTDSKGQTHRSIDPVGELIDVVLEDVKGQIPIKEGEKTRLLGNKTKLQEAEGALSDVKVKLETDFGIDVDNGNIIENIEDKKGEIQGTIDEGQEYLEEAYDEQGLTLDLGLDLSIGNASRIENVFDTLKNAVTDFGEGNLATAETLDTLKTMFGTVEGFDKFYKILATGQGDAEEAAKKLINSYIIQGDLLKNLTEEQKEIMKFRLEALGFGDMDETFAATEKIYDKMAAYEEDLKFWEDLLENYESKKDMRMRIGKYDEKLVEMYRNTIEGLKSELAKLEDQKVTIEIETDFTPLDLGTVGSVFDEYTSKMETLASIQAEVADGFIISAQKAREFAAIYPEILQGATVAANGEITLNKDVVNAFIKGEREKQNAAIDTQISNLKAQMEEVDAKIKFAEAQIAIAQGAAETGTDVSWQEAQEKITASNILLGHLINNGVDEEVAFEEAARHMSEDSTEFQTIVGQVADDNYKNLDMSADGAADSMAVNATAMQNSLIAVTEQAHEAAKAIKAAGEGEIEGSTNKVKGITYGKESKPLELVNTVKTFDSGETSEKVDPKEAPNLQELYGSLINPEAYDNAEDFIKAQQDAIDKLKGVYSGYEGKIALLEAQKNRPLKDFDPDKDKDKDKEDKRLENLQKKYEGKISNLENQKTWLENEIAREEEIGLGVSKSYYEEQIKLNDKLTDEYEAQRNELIALKDTYPKGSEEWYEVTKAIWEMDHAIQELTTDSIKSRKAIIDLYTEAFEKIGEAFSDKSNISEKRIESMENYAELLDLRGDTATKGLFDAMIAEYDTQLATKWDQFNAQQDIYNGLVATRDQYTPDSDAWIYYNQQVIKAQAGLMDVKTEIQGIEIAQEQKRDEFKELAIQRWDDVQEAYANRDQYYQNQIDLNDKYISKLETLGINVPDEAYEAQIESLEAASASKWEQYLQARQEMIDYEGIYGADSQEYIDKYNETIQLHHEYLDKENEILEKQQQIFDNQIDRFNQVIDRINNATQRMQNISGLIEDEDVATEDGEWTSEGLTRLGMAYQQMEYYKQSSDEIAKKMAEVTEAYNNGEISEKKYYETMQELENQQWDAINSYEDMKDSIVDLNEARIDMIEEGIDKEIEAYSELIELKKEELQAERDLFDFKKDVEKQTKDIAALERRIASMGGSTDASTIAERTKLEAQLREAKEGLDDTYYNHSMDSIGNALDDELDAYTKSAEDYIESLRESLKDTDLFIEQTFQKVIQGSNTVLETIYGLSETYKFPIDTNLTSPWENATQKSLDFETYAKGHIKNIYDYVEEMKGSLAQSLGDPYDSRTTDDMGNPLYEFSWYAAQQIDKIITDNTSKQDAMKTSLDGGFTQAQSSIQGWETAASGAVQNVIDKFVGNEEKGEIGLLGALNKTADRINSMPTYDGGYTAPKETSNDSGSGGNNNNNSSSITKFGNTYNANVLALQKILKGIFGYNLGRYGPNKDGLDGYYGTAGGETWEAVKKMQKQIGVTPSGKYDQKTYEKLKSWLNAQPVSSWFRENNVSVPAAMYAKGTMGTTKDQWAIDSEPWLGDELVLVPTASGNLSYMRKGTSVLTADLTRELMDIANIGVDGLTMPKFDSGINIISNAVSKPELNFSFDSLVHVDNCSQETLKDLEKMVDTKINQFSKQMNYAIKRFK